jgi:NtrC-family two-component system sensor histidine kinase KinB
MRLHRLQTRFILAGALLILATMVSSIWSVLTFARLSAVVDDTLRESQETIDLSAALAGSLEREDDALLLALSGEREKTRPELVRERQRSDGCYERLLTQLANGEAEERRIVVQLRHEIDAYRAAGDALLASPPPTDSLERYHVHVNPLLRQAVASCGAIREENFRSMQASGIRARDEAHRATWGVSLVAVVALLLAVAVAVWLARSVLKPVRELTAGVDALRQGDFDQRVPTSTGDELGLLAAGFNRMAEALAEYRSSSLGELLTAKATLEATLNALPDAVLVIAPDGSIAALNSPARAILAATRVAVAHRVQDLALAEDHRAAIDAALAGRTNFAPRIDFSRTLPVLLDGQPHRFLLTAVPIPEFLPRRFGAVVVLADVTEFAQLDELRSELIGVASHELKTPLTTLRMNLLLLGERADNLTDRQREILSAAKDGCEELSGTIDELLDVTRIEAGQLRLNLAPVDVAAVLAQVLRSLQPRFQDAQVRVEVVRATPSSVVQADAARLGMVLANLLTNALKYSPPGGTVTVRLASGQNAQPDRPATLQITVTDAGPGIPPEYRERVFEKFFRVEHHQEHDRNPVRGTGIGLYLCREIIKAHGGTIRCEAGDGGIGTRVAISLPIGL